MASAAGSDFYELGGLTGPDQRFVDDLHAIDEYVRNEARARVAQWPNSLSAIEDYEKWRQGVTWLEEMTVPNDVMANAKIKRNAINAAQGQVTPGSNNVEPGAWITSPPNPAAIPWGKIGLWAAAGAAAVGVIYVLGSKGGRTLIRRVRSRGRKGQ